MGSPKTLTNFTLSDIGISSQGQSDFEALYLVKAQLLVHMLLFNINKKAYVGSPSVQLHLTLVALIGQNQGPSDFEELYLVKEHS